jgi:hypothetical protein
MAPNENNSNASIAFSWFWSANIARSGPMCNVCFSFGIQSIARLGPKSRVCLRSVCGYCRVGSHVHCEFK